MKYTFICLLFIAGCSGSKSSDSAKEDPVFGNWIYETPGSNGQRGIVGVLDKSGTITLMTYYGYATNSNTVTTYFRKSVGTFIRTGDSFNITYSYETCTPVGNETLILKTSSNDQLYVDVVSQGLFLTFNRAPANSSPLNITAIEDKDCNILAKLEKKEKRSIASIKSKSFFDRVLK